MSLSSNEARFLVKVDQKGGGLYKVNYEKAGQSLKLNIIESIIQEKWGLLGCRIWRILQQKKKLDLFLLKNPLKSTLPLRKKEIPTKNSQTIVFYNYYQMIIR